MKNKETKDEIVVRVNYYDDDKTGERHYDIEGMHNEFNRKLVLTIANHIDKAVRVNEAYKPLNK